MKAADPFTGDAVVERQPGQFARHAKTGAAPNSLRAAQLTRQRQITALEELETAYANRMHGVVAQARFYEAIRSAVQP